MLYFFISAMTNFHIKVDDKFKELFKKMNGNKIDINELLDLKTFIYDAYSSENSMEDKRIKDGFHMIDYKI